MTRKNDSYLTLQERADKANKAKGDLLYLFTQIQLIKATKTERQYQVVLSTLSDCIRTTTICGLLKERIP